MNHNPGRSNGPLRRYWLPTLLIWLAGSAGLMAFAYSWLKPTFDARSQVKVETDNTSIFGQGTHQVDFSQFMQSQVALIANPTIIGAALSEHPELASTPMLKNAEDREYEFGQALRAGILPRTNIIQVEMSSPIPSEAAQLVNAVVEAYLKHAQATYDTSTQKRIDLLKVTRDEQRNEITKQRTLVQSLSEQITRDALKSGTLADQSKLEYARRDLKRAEAVYDRIESTLNQYQFDARDPTARVELVYKATPSVRPNSDRRRQLMAAAPVAVGLLVMGPLVLRLRGARMGDPGPT